MKRATVTFIFLVFFAMLVLSLDPALAKHSAGSRHCPVQPEREALAEYSHVYQEQKVYFCCDVCLEAFKSKTELYTAALGRQSTATVNGSEPTPSEISTDGQATGTQDEAVDRWGFISRLNTRSLILLSFSLSALLLLLIRKRYFISSRKETRISPRGVHVLLTMNVVSLALLIGTGWTWYVTREELQLVYLKDMIHYTTYYDFGDPPKPMRPETAKRISATFYRGNDERSPLLFNGGNYRTCTFRISLTTGNGKELDYGDVAADQELYLRAEIIRARNTPDFFFDDERMNNILLTRKADPFLGYKSPLADAVKLSTLKRLHHWEALYPIGKIPVNGKDKKESIVYIAEKRYLDSVWGDPKLIGTRFHYAIQFELFFEDGRLVPDSDLWMGALYRTRRFPQWKLPLKEWFSHELIPELPGKNTDDPKLLGIDEYAE